MKKIMQWLMGPFTKLAQAYIESRERTKQAELEREVKRDFLNNELKKELLSDDGKRAELLAAILRRDRGDARTAWIRPVTAGIALVFWIALCLSQMVWGGNGILPITWNVPPGLLGQAFLAFPMGVLATFYVARPIEKFLIGKQP